MARQSARLSQKTKIQDDQNTPPPAAELTNRSAAPPENRRTQPSAGTAAQAPPASQDPLGNVTLISQNAHPNNRPSAQSVPPQPTPAPSHLAGGSKLDINPTLALAPVLNRLEYEREAEKFNILDQDLLLGTNILQRMANVIKQVSPACFGAYREIRNQTGDRMSYWHTVNGAKSLLPQWQVFFSWLPEFLKYAPVRVRTAFWEGRTITSISSNQFDPVLPSRVITPGRGDYKLQDVMTKEQEQQEETLTLQRMTNRKRKVDDVEEESSARAPNKRVATDGRTVGSSQVSQPRAAPLAPPQTQTALFQAAMTAPQAPAALSPTAGPGALALRRGVTAYAWPPGRIWAYQQGGDPIPGQQRPHHPINSVATPPEVNLRYLGTINVSAVEFLTFFPLHTIWREPMWRLDQSNWGVGGNAIVKFILYSRSIGDPRARKATTVAHQRRNALDWAHAIGPLQGGISDCDFSIVSMDRGNIVRTYEDYRLVDLADGVVHMPTLGDRGYLTAAIELARSRGDNVMLSGLGQYVQANLAHLGVPAIDTDDQAYTRWFGSPKGPEARAVENHCRNINYVRK